MLQYIVECRPTLESFHVVEYHPLELVEQTDHIFHTSSRTRPSRAYFRFRYDEYLKQIETFCMTFEAQT